VTGFRRQWCNAYGAENRGGHPVVFGGFLDNPVSVTNICRTPAVHRFRWACEHGHLGPIVNLCQQHYYEFTGDPAAPWNVRRDVRACPRCAAEAPTPEEQHKCKVRLETVS
jgi:hypothetical protein